MDLTYVTLIMEFLAITPPVSLPLPIFPIGITSPNHRNAACPIGNALKALGGIDLSGMRQPGTLFPYVSARHIFRHDVCAVTTFFALSICDPAISIAPHAAAPPPFPYVYVPCECSLRRGYFQSRTRLYQVKLTRVPGGSFRAPKRAAILSHYEVYIFLHCEVWIKARSSGGNLSWSYLQIREGSRCNVRSVGSWSCL